MSDVSMGSRCCIGIIIFAAGSCFAQMSPMEWFARMDKDKDERLSTNEVESPRFKEYDADADGYVTRAEYRAAVEGAALKKPSALNAITYRTNGGPSPLSKSTAFTDLVFTRDWTPGTKDANGKLMSGTECNYIVAHGGMLFAAISMWNHDKAVTNPGPGVYVKRSADAPWQVEVQFPPPCVRTAVLASLTFKTDGAGKALAKPATVLIAGGSIFESTNEIVVFVRKDASGLWVKSRIADRRHNDFGEMRLLNVYRDSGTRTDVLIAVTTGGSVHRAVYDTSAEGLLRWANTPELSDRKGRIMSFGKVNGNAYLAVDISPSMPKNGGLFKRIDGEQPRWEWIGEWGNRIQHRGVAWIRAITAIPDPDTPGKELMLVSREVDGVIETIDPRNYERRVEFDLRAHFGGLVGAKEGERFTTLFAYNEMTSAVHPDTKERVHLIGGGIMPGLAGNDARAKCAWCLIRHADGSYGTAQVFDPAYMPHAVGGLRSVRTICVSPFASDKGRVIYFGGFDAAKGPHRDTAWIFKGTVPAKMENKKMQMNVKKDQP